MLSNSTTLQSGPNLLQDKTLQAQIDHAYHLLSTNNIQSDSQDDLISTLTSILHQIRHNSTKDLTHLTSSLDRLAVMLLLILTTGLESIRNNHILTTAKNFLEAIQGFTLSEITNKGISEFLLKLDAYFSKMRMQEEQDPQIYQDEEEKESGSGSQGLTVKDQISLDMIENYEQVFPDIQQRFQEDQTERPKDLWDLIPLQVSEQEKQKYSVSILDLEGNFIIMDRNSKAMFELNTKKQKTINLFELMIPFSRYYLEKTFGNTMFSVPEKPTKTFSYTIYSRSSFVKYGRTIKTCLKKDKGERIQVSKKQRFTAEEASLAHEENSLYYKYLQTLTSNAILVNLSKENIELFLYWKEIKVIFMQKELFEDVFSEDEEVSKPVILLLTRKANHIQKFRYDLMENSDKKIIKMQKSILKRVKKRLAGKMEEEESCEIGIVKSEYDEEIM